MFAYASLSYRCITWLQHLLYEGKKTPITTTTILWRKQSSPTQHRHHIKTHLLEDFPVFHFYYLCSDEEQDAYWHVAEITQEITLRFRTGYFINVSLWKEDAEVNPSTHHIMIWINLIVASFRASKNSRRICPFSPILPMTRPNTMQNTRSPNMLAPSTYVPVILWSLVMFWEERRASGSYNRIRSKFSLPFISYKFVFCWHVQLRSVKWSLPRPLLWSWLLGAESSWSSPLELPEPSVGCACSCTVVYFHISNALKDNTYYVICLGRKCGLALPAENKLEPDFLETCF